MKKETQREKQGIVMYRKRFKFELGGVFKNTDFCCSFMNY